MQVLCHSLHLVRASYIVVLASLADWWYQGVQVMNLVHREPHAIS